MTPQQLYNTIKRIYPHYEVASICHTNKDCLRNGFCSNVQSVNVINFDFVKEDFYKGQTPTPASVDAVCVSTNGKQKFCFVEMKGWQQYMNKISRQKRTPEETALGYNLAGKLNDSQQLCIDLVADKDLFSKISVQFLLVTDIDTKINGIEAFQSLLNQLGQTSSNLYSKCITESCKVLESEIFIDKVYLTCKNFDQILNSIL